MCPIYLIKFQTPPEPPQDHSLNADPVPAASPAPLRRSHRVTKPPDKYGFPPLSLTANRVFYSLILQAGHGA